MLQRRPLIKLGTPTRKGVAGNKGGRSCSAAMGTVLLLLLLSLTACSDAQRSENVLFWKRASDPKALCNDYTRAGFFLNRNSNSSKWVIFLESGSLCYSNDTCNRRFFRETVSLDVVSKCHVYHWWLPLRQKISWLIISFVDPIPSPSTCKWIMR